jgi:hypothetical protein
MRLNPVSLYALILLAFFTVVFTLLTVMKTSSIKPFHESGGSIKPIPALRKEHDQLVNQMKASQERVTLRLRELDKIDWELNVHRVYYSPDKGLLGGIALPEQQEAEILGTKQKLKDSRSKVTVDLIAASAKRLDAAKAEAESDGRQRFPTLDEAIRKRQDELNVILKRISDQEAAFTRDRDELARKADGLATAKDKAEKIQRDEYGTRATRIAQLEDKIRELLELQLKWLADIEPDANVLQADNDQVIIDIGDREGVKPGQLFQVFTYHQGRQIEKGMAEVVQVSSGITRCRLTAVTDPRNNPVGPGDLVGNPLFDIQRTPVVFVAGEFTQYAREDIEGFVRAAGARVASKLGPGCDLLVAGERSDREQAAARQFQVFAMSEETLLRYVQKSFAPTSVK